jgi:hypothetical protein
MKGITTLAALPNGAGCLGALPAEVGEAKPAPIAPSTYRRGATLLTYDVTRIGGNVMRLPEILEVLGTMDGKAFGFTLSDPGFTAPDLLDTSK